MRKILAGIAAAMLVAFTVTSCKPKEIQQKKSTAKVVFLTGVVKVNGEDTKIGHVIKQDDVIETTKNASVRVQLDEKTMIKLNENSRLVYKIPKESTIQLDKGWMSGITKRKFTKSGQYYIKTPTAAAAVRGTSYCLKVENPKSTYFCTCNGSIHQHGIGDKEHGETVTAAHHAGRRFVKQDDGSIKTEKAGLEYHSDADIEELAETIDETVNWEKAE